MSIIKKITALSAAAVILIGSFTGFDSYATEKISAPKTCEDYMKLADTYLHKDDVVQALAVLDEGIEKLSAGEQDVEKQDVDLLSQRKNYILAGTVAIRTNLAENEYEDDGSIYSGSVIERDKNGNKIKEISCGEGGKVWRVSEYQYDSAGNMTEYKEISYDSAGNSSISSHTTWAYDTDGNEIKYEGYSIYGEKKAESEYDANGNQVKYTEYDKDGKIVMQTKSTYDKAGNEIEHKVYDEDGRCSERTVKSYDEHGNVTKWIESDADGDIVNKWESAYDKNGNQIKHVRYKDAASISYWYEYEYDENGNVIKFVRYDGAVTVSFRSENEYDSNGNEIRHKEYDGKGNLTGMSEYRYDEAGRNTYISDERNGVVIRTYEKEYDKSGNRTKLIYTIYDQKTGQKKYQSIEEYTYDRNGNMTKYACTKYDEEKEKDYFFWKRKYNADNRETDFSFYDNEKTASYQSKTEYDENGLAIKYTGCDKDGDVFVRKETEYDTSARIIRENYYDTDGNLIQYYENEYDNFGSVTRQVMYEGGILKSEKQISYTYRFIGNIEEDNLKQREVFNRFLQGKEKIHYCSDTNSVEDGRIVEETITELIDFKECSGSWYTFLDMTGDGIEELVIDCSSEYENMYVIQYSCGVLKVIWNGVGGKRGTYPMEYSGRTGICRDFFDDSREYYFFDGKGKTKIILRDYTSSQENREGDWSHHRYDTDSFEERDISVGEYYDITDKITKEINIDWQKLEKPNK